MAGGLFNLISVGNANVILTGNPTKTFFKVAYSKYTNFGMQKFRIDYEGSRDLRLTEDSIFSFKIKRYADLLMDCYLVVKLPNIWSPVYNPCPETNNEWVGYDFKWIQNIGFQMIRSIEINCGSVCLQKYTGEYLMAMVERDFTETKKELIHKMTGNVMELNNPALIHNRLNRYPNAYYTENVQGAEPSIRGHDLFIPLNTWFSLDSRCAFPLICLQYNELTINVTLRPIQELFQVRDVFDYTHGFPYIQPDFTLEQFQMYRFLQTPPSRDIHTVEYENKNKSWNTDVHMICNYCFLSNEESRKFAMEDQAYLVRDVSQYFFENVTGNQRVKLANTASMVSNWMFYFQRNDVNMRNEWSNYTNWPYQKLPDNIVLPPKTGVTPYLTPDGKRTNIYITGSLSNNNQKEILTSLGILFEGEYRENILHRGVYDYIEKYVRTAGNGMDGLYCYNFCLKTDPFTYQPSGAINMSKFKNVEFEISTYIPPVDAVHSPYDIICDEQGNPISVQVKTKFQLFKYNYNMVVFEERYNVLSFMGGNCSMMYAK